MRTAIVVVVGFMLIMLGVDVWIHDETLVEAWKSSPHEFLHYLATLLLLAWQYKLATLVVFAAAIAIVYIRRVPGVKSH